MSESNKIQLSASLKGVLRGMRERNFSLQNALLELIDNSFDAKATAISIQESEGDLIIEDDGRGISNIESALTIGKSDKTDGIGRYGVGLNDACVKFSDATTVESKGVRATAPWLDVIRGGSDGTIRQESIQDDGKTRIILWSFRNRYKSSIQTEEIRKTYTPLIGDGALTISVNGKWLNPLEDVKIESPIDVSFDFAGKKVRLTGGLFTSNDPMGAAWRGYNPYYQGRLIGSGNITTMGTGDEPCTNFSFRVNLIDCENKWKLSTNKDEVEDLEDLLSFIYNTYTRPILIEGAEHGKSEEIRAIEKNITELLNNGSFAGDSGNITRKKKKDSKSGTVEPTNQGSPKRRTFSADRLGEYVSGIGKTKTSLFDFHLAELAGNKLAEIHQLSKRTIIKANLANPFVSEHIKNKGFACLLAYICYHMPKCMQPGEIAIGPEELLGYTGESLANL